jgi:hypothetical protein
MQRSERLVVLTVVAWERAIGRVEHVPIPFQDEVDPRALEGVALRLSEVADRWRALPVGASITLEWPRRLTFDGSKSRRGRRTTRRTPKPARHRTQRAVRRS